MKPREARVLILYNSVPYFIRFMTGTHMTADWIYKKNLSFFQRIIRKICEVLGFSQAKWYGKWKKDLVSYDTVVLFASLKNREVIKYLKRSKPTVRIIYWYWNPVNRVGTLENKFLTDVELWSFDPCDCVEYGMKFNTTFYFKDIVLPPAKIEFDALFLGLDKGRFDQLKDLERKIENIGAVGYFKIIRTPREKIPYQEYLKLVAKTRCIIDIVAVGQSGLTVRPMESIFLKKKLITNDVNIKKQEFYNKQNIFILGVDDDTRLANFLKTPYSPVDEEVVNEYDIHQWVRRFNLT